VIASSIASPDGPTVKATPTEQDDGEHALDDQDSAPQRGDEQDRHNRLADRAGLKEQEGHRGKRQAVHWLFLAHSPRQRRRGRRRLPLRGNAASGARRAKEAGWEERATRQEPKSSVWHPNAPWLGGLRSTRGGSSRLFGHRPAGALNARSTTELNLRQS